MKTIDVSEAEGLTLNYLVAVAEGYTPVHNPVFNGSVRYGWYDSAIGHMIKNYSTDAYEANAIIEREKIDTYTQYPCSGPTIWYGRHKGRIGGTGPTAIIAAMRCHVATNLGNKVEVPDALAP